MGTGSWHLWGFSRDRGGRVVDGLAHDRCWSRRNAVTMLCSAVPSPGTLGGLVVPRSGTGAGPNSGVAVGAKAPPCRARATLFCPFKLDRDTVRRPGAEAPRLEECAPGPGPGPAARESPATVPSTNAVGPADPMPLHVDGTHNNDEHHMNVVSTSALHLASGAGSGKEDLVLEVSDVGVGGAGGDFGEDTPAPSLAGASSSYCSGGRWSRREDDPAGSTRAMWCLGVQLC